MVRTVQRAIESRQAKLDKKHGKISVFDLQSRMDELLEKGEITVGGRPNLFCNGPDLGVLYDVESGSEYFQ